MAWLQFSVEYTTSQSYSPVCFYSGYGAQKAQTHPTLNTWRTVSLNTWRTVSLLKVPTIYQAQALSQGCQAWGFKKGTQAEEEQEMQGNKARLEFHRCTFNSNRKKDRRTLGSSSNSLREGQHSLNSKENITRPLQQIQPPDNKEVTILSQLMISQADGNRSIIAASRVAEIWAAQVAKGELCEGTEEPGQAVVMTWKLFFPEFVRTSPRGTNNMLSTALAAPGCFLYKNTQYNLVSVLYEKLFWSTD